MARGKSGRDRNGNSAAKIGYEAQLWQMADTLRGSMDTAEYKHVVLGLIFHRCMSPGFLSEARNL